MSTSGLLASSRQLAALGAGLLLVAKLSSALGAESTSPALLSHRAVYSMSRHTGSTASDIAGINGRLEVTFEVACDGWRMEQYIGFRIYHVDGAGLEHVAHLSGWESADGADFWFSTRSYQDRELLDDLSGVAHLDAPGEGGEVRFARPEKSLRVLPDGTVFPARHLAELITAAVNGEQHLTRTVFDGSTLDSPYEITAFIGKQRAAAGDDLPSALANKRSWSFRFAYFMQGAVQPSPEFELSALLYENGVAGSMIYDYGDFAIDVELRELEVLPVAECAR